MYSFFVTDRLLGVIVSGVCVCVCVRVYFGLFDCIPNRLVVSVSGKVLLLPTILRLPIQVREPVSSYSGIRG